MPTRKPRYVVTDTGATAEMLDRAARAWPDVSDRKELLLLARRRGRASGRRRVALTGERLLLVDKSAWVRGASAADVDGELCLCVVTRLELLFSARSPQDCEALQEDLALFRDLRMDAETFAAALTGQRELARAGHHRIPLPDLLIAACAQQHAATVLHVDRNFEALREVFSFTAVRL